jgi:hypothetical protein
MPDILNDVRHGLSQYREVNAGIAPRSDQDSSFISLKVPNLPLIPELDAE